MRGKSGFQQYAEEPRRKNGQKKHHPQRDFRKGNFRINNVEDVLKVDDPGGTACIAEDIRTEVLSQLKSIVGEAEVQVEEHIDESIIGGFVLRVGDLEFNASVANKLQKLKREFVSNPNIKE